jgi:cell division septal protein FtsQ
MTPTRLRRPAPRGRQPASRLSQLRSATVYPWRAGRRLGQLVRPRFFFVLLLGLVGYGALTLYTNPIFRVRQVDVVGAHWLPPAAVVQAANLSGRNIFQIDTGAVSNQILALGVPEQVTVHYQLPNTAIIDVSERLPAYIWKVDPTLYLVADDGTVLGPTSREGEAVIVVDSDHRPVQVGQKVDVAVLREASYLEQVLPKAAGLSPHYFLYSRALGLVVPTADGFQVVVGDSQQLGERLADFGPALQAARAQQPRPTWVDLRFLGHPYLHS